MALVNILKEEITNDPEGIGYSSMNDVQVAAALNARDREVIRPVLSGSTIFNAIVPSEFAALDDQTKQFVRDVFSLGDAVDVGEGTNARAVLIGAFEAGTTTRDNLVAAVTVTQTRAEELGMSRVKTGHVQEARRG